MLNKVKSASGGKTVAIISDIHDNEPNLKKVLDYCKKENINTIICCGDLATKETLDFLNDNFDGVIHYTFGNADHESLRNLEYARTYKNSKMYPSFGEIEVHCSDSVTTTKIAFVHFPEMAKELCQTGKYDFVFHGHTHKPWTEKINGCVLLNPGNVAGTFFAPTFAVWNTEDGKFELIRVNHIK